MRRKSRESAFKYIYENLFIDCQDQEIFFEDQNLTLDEKEYTQQIIDAYLQNGEEIKQHIQAHLRDYFLDRVYKIDLALVILACCECKYFQVPKAVEINEVLELSKIYSTEKSPSFINGLLKELL